MTVAEFHAQHGEKSFLGNSGTSAYRCHGHYLYRVLLNFQGYDGYLVSVGEVGYQNDWIEPAKPDDVIEVVEEKAE